jgi:hypothetical protein
MFSSNQKFIITGDHIEDLSTALSCALNIYNSPRHYLNKKEGIKAYKIEENGTMLFYPYYNDKNKEKLTLIPEEEIGNFEYLMLTIQLYLTSKKFKNIVNNMSYYDGDGSSHIGWELGCYDMYYNYLMKEFDKLEDTKDKFSHYPEYDHYACLYLKPFWTYYAK